MNDLQQVLERLESERATINQQIDQAIAGVQFLLTRNGSKGPAAPARGSRRQPRARTGGVTHQRSSEGRTSPPSPELLARAKALWEKGKPNAEIATLAASMGRTVKPQAIYGWADRYGWPKRGKKNGLKVKAPAA